MQSFMVSLEGAYHSTPHAVQGSKPSIAVKRVMEGAPWLERYRTTARGPKPLALKVGETLTITVRRTA